MLVALLIIVIAVLVYKLSNARKAIEYQREDISIGVGLYLEGKITPNQLEQVLQIIEEA